MCNFSGIIVDVNLNKLKTKRYKCKECENTFKGAGRKVICPSCQSDNIKII